MKRETSTCPSARNRPGARLLGRANGNTVTFLGAPRRISRSESDLLEQAGGDRVLRFADTCIETRCAQWNGLCRVAEVVAEAAEKFVRESEQDLPNCGIRHACRW